MEAYFFYARSHVVSLAKLQNEALRLCTGNMRSTPTMCLQHACNEMPLELKHRLLCSRYRAHLLTFPTHPAKTIIEDGWQELFPDFGNFCSFNMLTKPTITGNLLRANVLRVFDAPHGCFTTPNWTSLFSDTHNTPVPQQWRRFFCPGWLSATVRTITFIPMVQKQRHLLAVAYTLNNSMFTSQLRSTPMRRRSVQNYTVFSVHFIVLLPTRFQRR